MFYSAHPLRVFASSEHCHFQLFHVLIHLSPLRSIAILYYCSIGPIIHSPIHPFQFVSVCMAFVVKEATCDCVIKTSVETLNARLCRCWHNDQSKKCFLTGTKFKVKLLFYIVAACRNPKYHYAAQCLSLIITIITAINDHDDGHIITIMAIALMPI